MLLAILQPLLDSPAGLIVFVLVFFLTMSSIAGLVWLVAQLPASLRYGRRFAAFVVQMAPAYWEAFRREWQELWEG